MALLIVAVYFIIIGGIGMPLAKFFFSNKTQPIELLASAFLAGSIITGLYIFSISHLHLITNSYVFGFTAISFFLTLIYIKDIFLSFKACYIFLKKYLIKQDKWSRVFFIVLIILLAWILLLSYTPPRAADAMRYHLAQLKDIVQNHGFVLRPYCHYNFPLYFSLLFLPIFMLLKGVGIKLAVCVYFLLSLFILLRIAKKIKLKYSRFLFLSFFLIPIVYHEAHIVTNDWALIFYSLIGFLFLLKSSETKNIAWIYFAFLALGFAMGIKYQSIILIPWYLIIAYPILKNTKKLCSIYHLLGSFIIMTLVASPFYIRNFINLGNPVWPLAQNIFARQHDYLYQIVQQFNQGIQGTHSFHGVFVNLKTFLTYPQIPITIWFLILLGVIFTKRTELKIGLGILLYFIVWWIFQPCLYIRFSLYALPIGLIAAVSLYEMLINKKQKILLFGYRIIVLITAIYFIAMAGWYSIFYVKYYFDRNLDSYHKYTWYYDSYKWINAHIPRNSLILCIVSAGQTYYLDRPYLRADPTLSGLIDWNSIENEEQLLKKLKINYIFYDFAYWSAALGGKNKMELINKLIDLSSTKIIFIKKEDLYSSRIKKQYSTTSTYLLKIEGNR